MSAMAVPMEVAEQSPVRYVSALGAPKVIDEEKMILGVVISTREIDRDGDLVEPRGLDFDNYMRNPVVLWAHDLKSVPIGKTLSITVTDDTVEAMVQFADTEMGRELFGLYMTRVLNAWSVGFLPGPNCERMETAIGNDRTMYGYHVKSGEMVELSAVPIGVNPDALTKIMATIKVKGIREAIQKSLEPKPKEEPKKGKRKMVYNCCADGSVELLEIKAPKDGYRQFAKCDGKGLRAGLFTKSLQERGASGAIPIYINFVSDSKGIGVEVTFEPVLETENEIIEAKILSVTARMLSPEVAPEPKQKGQPGEPTGKTAGGDGRKNKGEAPGEASGEGPEQSTPADNADNGRGTKGAANGEPEPVTVTEVHQRQNDLAAATLAMNNIAQEMEELEG